MIISLSGLRGSGKDTIANYLVKEYGFVSFSWADSLKDALSSIFGWDRKMLEGNTPRDRELRKIPDEWWELKLDWANTPYYKKTLKRFTPETALTYVGTDIIREHFNTDIWVYSLLNKVSKLDPSINIVVKDTRYPNEVWAMEERSAEMITVLGKDIPDYFNLAAKINEDYVERRICKEEWDRKIVGICDTYNVHSSEVAWIGISPWFRYIKNQGSIEDLYSRLDKIVPLISGCKKIKPVNPKEQDESYKAFVKACDSAQLESIRQAAALASGTKWDNFMINKPQYELDEGALTDAQLESIRQASGALPYKDSDSDKEVMF